MQNLIATKLGVQRITGITVFNIMEKKSYDPLPDLEVSFHFPKKLVKEPVSWYIFCWNCFIQTATRTALFENCAKELAFPNYCKTNLDYCFCSDQSSGLVSDICGSGLIMP